MQTSPAGTYSGMMHCAGGILKNEGPLAFYKVRVALRALLYMLTMYLGHLVTLARHRCLRLDPVRCPGVHKTHLSSTEPCSRCRRTRRYCFRLRTALHRWCRRRYCQRHRLMPRRAHPYPYVLSPPRATASNTNIPPLLRLGLQTQSATNPIYKGPGDAISTPSGSPPT